MSNKPANSDQLHCSITRQKTNSVLKIIIAKNFSHYLLIEISPLRLAHPANLKVNETIRDEITEK